MYATKELFSLIGLIIIMGLIVSINVVYNGSYDNEIIKEIINMNNEIESAEERFLNDCSIPEYAAKNGYNIRCQEDFNIYNDVTDDILYKRAIEKVDKQWSVQNRELLKIITYISFTISMILFLIITIKYKINYKYQKDNHFIIPSNINVKKTC